MMRLKIAVLVIFLALGNAAARLPKEAEAAAAVLAEEFLWEIADIPALSRQLQTTPSGLKDMFRDAFIELTAAGDYEKFFSAAATQDQQAAALARFLHDYADGGAELDAASAFLLWKIVYRRTGEFYTDADGTRLRTTDDETRMGVQDFCLHALKSRKSDARTPQAFAVAQKHLYVQSWDQLAHYLSFVIPSVVTDQKAAWWWIDSTISLLRDTALKHSPDSSDLCSTIGIIFYAKLSSGLDARESYYRGRMALDTDSALQSSNMAFLAVIHPAYAHLERTSPASHAVYWSEYGLGRAKGKQNRLKGNLSNALKQSCEQGRTALIEYGGEPLAVQTYPNFQLFDLWYDKWKEVRASEGTRIDPWFRRDMESAVKLSVQYDKQEMARKFYARLGELFPQNDKYKVTFESFVEQEVFSSLAQLETTDLTNMIYTVIIRSVMIIASGNTADGRGAAMFAQRLFNMLPSSAREGLDFAKTFSMAAEALSADWPAVYKDRLKEFNLSAENKP